MVEECRKEMRETRAIDAAEERRDRTRPR